MAKTAGVWGIDIGQAAFKALRCQLVDGKVVADAFDYIEYPKILSQPEAEPEKMIQEAIEQFLSRNDLKGYRVALAVPGQNGLAKFFKPPPVDAKRIPELVKFEAKQQIPFALEDVIWDFQQMGGAEVDGFALETEVGLFAMKREQVFRAMRPFQEPGVELDFIQLAPLSIYNFITYDVLSKDAGVTEYNPDDPPPSLVVLSMGTDTTDLVVTNGFRVWQRSIPLGGNHFTKQLTKELKLTFAKAEHLKRNARQAEDPRAVFKAMRPVFNDLVTEVQRSIGYFQGIDRKAKIGGVVVLGNAVKLPGLRQFLAKNLGYEVSQFDRFSKLEGSAVLSAPAFRDNQLSFAVSYGLCLQGLGEANLQTNLVPPEIMTDRLVRSKKPWAVASVAALLLACTFNVAFYSSRLHQVEEDRQVANVSWKQASDAINQANSVSTEWKGKDEALKTQLQRIEAVGEELVGNADRRVLWLEMLKTLNTAMPVTPNINPGEIPDVDKVKFWERQEIHVEQCDVQYYDDLKTWFAESVKNRYIMQAKTVPSLRPVPAAAVNATATAAAPAGPTGKGWVVELQCYHFYNKDLSKQGLKHVLTTLIHNLKNGKVVFPVPINKIRPGVMVRHPVAAGRSADLRVTDFQPVLQPDAQTGKDTLTGYTMKLAGVENPLNVARDGLIPVVFTMQEMGIDYPLVTTNNRIDKEAQVPNPNYEPPESGYGGDPEAGGPGSGAPGISGSGAGAGASLGLPGEGGSAGSGAGGFGSGAPSQKSDEPQEPPFLTVPRYDCNVQFVWTEKLLSDRLEQQVKQWEAEKLQQSSQTSTDTDLAANLGGGA